MRPQRRPNRGPAAAARARRPAPGLTPILRLVGLIAAAILVVVLLVFWIQGCQNDAKTNAYKDYMEDVVGDREGVERRPARTLNNLARDAGDQAGRARARSSTGSRSRSSRTSTARRSLDPPGHLREANQQLIEALQLRVSGLRGLADAFQSTAKTTDADKAGTVLAEQAKRLLASDVVWDDLFKTPATQILDEQGITASPSRSRTSSANAGPRERGDVRRDRQAAATARRRRPAPSGGLHGTGIVSVTALPQGLVLSRVERQQGRRHDEPRVRGRGARTPATTSRRKIPVTLTIQKQGAPIKQTQTIDVINPGETKKVMFRNIDTTGVFGVRTTLKVDVQPVPGRGAHRQQQLPVPGDFQPRCPLELALRAARLAGSRFDARAARFARRRLGSAR